MWRCWIGRHQWGHSWSTEGWFYKTCGRCGKQEQFYGREAREHTRKYEAKLKRRARSVNAD